MTSQQDFTDEEWFLVRGTPSMIGSAVAQAGRSGIGGTMKEVMANVQTIMAGKSDYPDNALIQSIIGEQVFADRAEAKEAMQEQMQMARSKMAERGIKSAEALADAAVEDCQAVMALLNERATASEVEGYKSWMMAVAHAVSEAAKEGGFLGIGGERVSDSEEAIIGRISAALDTDSGESSVAEDGWSAS